MGTIVALPVATIDALSSFRWLVIDQMVSDQAPTIYGHDGESPFQREVTVFGSEDAIGFPEAPLSTDTVMTWLESLNNRGASLISSSIEPVIENDGTRIRWPLVPTT